MAAARRRHVALVGWRWEGRLRRGLGTAAQCCPGPLRSMAHARQLPTCLSGGRLLGGLLAGTSRPDVPAASAAADSSSPPLAAAQRCRRAGRLFLHCRSALALQGASQGAQTAAVRAPMALVAVRGWGGGASLWGDLASVPQEPAAAGKAAIAHRRQLQLDQANGHPYGHPCSPWPTPICSGLRNKALRPASQTHAPSLRVRAPAPAAPAGPASRAMAPRA